MHRAGLWLDQDNSPYRLRLIADFIDESYDYSVARGILNTYWKVIRRPRHEGRPPCPSK
jgi:hypothetical protein